MPASPGRRDSCGPRFLTTTSWLPSTSSTCSATRCAALRITTTGCERPAGHGRACRPAAARRARRRASSDRPRRSGRWHRPVRCPRPAHARPVRPASRARRCCSSPQRSMTTCVTAVVSGSTSRKTAPCPAAVAVSMRPPMALTSARTTSMPTPRPASSVTLSAVLKPGAKIRFARSASEVGASADTSLSAECTLADALQVQAGAVVAEFDRDFVAFLGQADGDGAAGVLAGLDAGLRGLDAVHHAVAQQMLEGAGHAVEHATVDFDRAADDVQPHLLAGFLGGLAHHAVQAVGHAFELDHARAQQVVLQVARQPRLRGQFVLGGLQRALQAALHRGHVVDRLGHHAREFLEAREAVHLQRVEGLRRGLGRLHARGDLRSRPAAPGRAVAGAALEVFASGRPASP